MNGPFFYLPPEAWGPDVCLEGQEARHLAQVLRLTPGCEVGLLKARAMTAKALGRGSVSSSRRSRRADFLFTARSTKRPRRP